LCPPRHRMDAQQFRGNFDAGDVVHVLHA
jgi:hypothetical protein